jgi:ABC-type bacteriocin/lantibiotic exporter with double-glycine peptidase domain
MKRRWLAPEVIQTSAMDCGPATLKCLLQGYGVHASYDRLREACQTDVDGSSIDTLEEIAASLGLLAEQILLPADHLLLPETHALPCIAVTRLPSQDLHFIVIWRQYGSLFEVMDPSIGRRWVTRASLIDEIYRHTMRVPSADWRDWAATDEFLAPLKRRIQRLGLDQAMIAALVSEALADPGWRRLGELDAVTRLGEAMCRAGSRETKVAARQLIAGAMHMALPREMDAFLEPHRHVGALPDSEDSGHLVIRGAVIIRCNGLRAGTVDRSKLAPELASALSEPPTHPMRALWQLIRSEGWSVPHTIVLASVAASAVLIIEALLFFSFLDIGGQLDLVEQRATFTLVLLGVLTAALCLESSIGALVWRLGRHLELRMRTLIQEKLRHLPDRHFRSRLTSDMAERAHRTYLLRELPDLAGQALRASLELIFTAAALVWLDGVVLWACVAVSLAFLVPVFALPMLKAQDLKWGTHGGALARFHLDALLGMIPVRAHGAQKSLRLAHEERLVEWMKAGTHLAQLTTWLNIAQWTIGIALIASLAWRHVGAQDYPAALLLLYWGMKIPMLSHELSALARRYPTIHTLTLRLLEPLAAGSAESAAADSGNTNASTDRRGVAIRVEGVDLRSGGHEILQNLSVRIEAGEHVVIIGSSGAGKSSLLGLLLGWHVPAAGSCLIDDEELKGAVLTRVRQETVWVDPTVHLWNRSFYENLRYGAEATDANFATNFAAADLTAVLQHLPQGLQTSLGEGGTLLSGGEGQRVRFGRALGRDQPRLALLDEPFRGLGRQERIGLLARARERWSGSTLLLVTHDIAAAQGFDRVLVMEDGQLVEDGKPESLARSADSHYCKLLALDAETRENVWSDKNWRRFWLEDSKLTEAIPE